MLDLMGRRRFQHHLSVPLFLEYQSVCSRLVLQGRLTQADADHVLDYLCHTAIRHEMYFLWRPHLPDPTDDMVLEVAITGQCESIVTFNVTDFRGADAFGVNVETPQEFLRRLGGMK